MAYFTQNAGTVNGPNQQQPTNKPEAERVTDAEYQVRPQSRAERFKNAFLPQDWATAARTGFVRTFVPGIKNLVLQGLVATFTGMLYGGGQTPPTNFQQPGGYIHYGGMYQNGYPNYYGYSNAQQQPVQQQAPARRPEFNQVVLPAGEMDKVKAKMLAYFTEYSWCSVGRFYDFCGITCEAPDRNFGWTYDQVNASIVTHSHKDANGVDWFYLNIARPTLIKH